MPQKNESSVKLTVVGITLFDELVQFVYRLSINLTSIFYANFLALISHAAKFKAKEPTR